MALCLSSVAGNVSEDAHDLAQVVDVVFLHIKSDGRPFQLEELPGAPGRHDTEDSGDVTACTFVEYPGRAHGRDALSQAIAQIVILGLDNRHQRRFEDELLSAPGQNEVADAVQPL